MSARSPWERAPGEWSPRITLLERTAGDAQHVSLRLDAPMLGRLYGYEGSFAYAIKSEGQTNG
ncbi:hypothetical protein [Salinibacterium sp.]|uniref:hypothetical protein n=1 Tax=Salinibacterium sp. TaxID=1915057 RepID=UPI00286A15F7|nr:hypothetical protein [Salinibacterium sp.]